GKGQGRVKELNGVGSEAARVFTALRRAPCPEALQLLLTGLVREQHLSSVADFLGMQKAIGVVKAQDICKDRETSTAGFQRCRRLSPSISNTITIFSIFLPNCGIRAGSERDQRAYDKECIPITKLDHLVMDIKIKSLEEIYVFSLSIKEFKIIDVFPGRIPKR
ncbi:hypothetical protein A6R68_21086, partial [Neotoma lepida]